MLKTPLKISKKIRPGTLYYLVPD